MKNLVRAIWIANLVLVALIGVQAFKATTADAALSPSYRAIYCYPTGTYWSGVKGQITKYPTYYANPTVNAYWTARMGAATQYCPA